MHLPRLLSIFLLTFLLLTVSPFFVPPVFAENFDDSAPDTLLSKPPLIPALQVLIPGWDTTDLVVMGKKGTPCKEGDLCVYTIDRYLNTIYKWGAGAGVIFAIVLMMMGGVEWMVGSAVGTIAKGKQRVINATFGLLLVLTTTTILTFINPKITQLSAIEVQVINPAGDTSTEAVLGGDQPAQVPSRYQPTPSTSSTSSSTSTPPAYTPPPPLAIPAASTAASSAPTPTQAPIHAIAFPAITTRYASASDIGLAGGLKFAPGVQVSGFILRTIEYAANQLYAGSRGQFHLYVADALRHPTVQAQYWFNNCYKKAGSPTSSFSCNPLTCNPFPRTAAESPVTTTDTMSSGPFKIKPEIANKYPTDAELLNYLKTLADENTNLYCAHTLGTTIDAWCGPRIGNFTDDADCHYRLEQVMKDIGYNRIASEPWHFEYAAQGFVPPTANARNGAWTDGRMQVTSKYCDKEIHGSSCEFNYGVCRASQGGSGYTNLQKGCCSDKTGKCLP
ncbi:hypothetical protein COV06_01695 [Candidatus Uhrbacteria bacterium CG10_big_fil_rev_8_21_14_0_10_50_16]|uniref:Peptidase M15B domain-containing protein n=1 Tax=Candidatus Uhrbacteria bacterium CG10_big_fil_rev_8_21_14_0_10_50_16 TaxID=1975039 RepID=A0A2H0RNH3_9BACT|nr:MAG: hypothetical protein COV06_01695 [Candidatus Uhrbacteria bacterium CG10_big_fil_rev_8_21_14_0_10_50_16]